MRNLFKKIWHRSTSATTPTSSVSPQPRVKPTQNLVDWTPILANDTRDQWQELKSQAQGPRVLIATGTGSYAIGTAVESLIAVALTLRGAQVHFLLCDEALSACSNALATQFSPDTSFENRELSAHLCQDCFASGRAVYDPLGLPLHRLGTFLTSADLAEIEDLVHIVVPEGVRDFTWNGIAVGEHAYAGAVRFYAVGTLYREPQWRAVQAHYLRSALKSAFAVRRLLEQERFDVICLNHGIYVPQGLVNAVALQARQRLVTWNPSYRSQTFIFSHGDTYHHTLLDEPIENWESMSWSETHEAEIMAYLKSRWQGTRDWIWFHEKPREELATIAKELGLDLSRACIGLLTNVMWDAQLHYRANAFPDMLTWVLETIRYFEQRPELQLVIRIHPAEIRGTIPSRQPLLTEIRNVFPVLPANVFIVTPESQISTYAVMEICNAVLIYGTKMGVELSSLGIPVIVAGEAWIRNKGLTLDASSPAEYIELLNQLPLTERLSAALTQKARKYAYHFFFRRMIPLEMMEPTGGWPPFKVQVNDLESLKPGASLGLDVICNGILNRTEFIYPAEEQITRLAEPG